VTRDPPRGAPRRDAPEHPPPPAETSRGPIDGSGNAASEEEEASAVGQRRGRDHDPAGRRVAARTSGRDVAAERESRGPGGQDAIVSAFYQTGPGGAAPTGRPPQGRVGRVGVRPGGELGSGDGPDAGVGPP